MSDVKVVEFFVNICDSCKFTKITGDRCIKCKYDKIVQAKIDMNLELTKEINHLNNQLAEKDKEIEDLKQSRERGFENLHNCLEKRGKEIESFKKQCEKIYLNYESVVKKCILLEEKISKLESEK